MLLSALLPEPSLFYARPLTYPPPSPSVDAKVCDLMGLAQDLLAMVCLLKDLGLAGLDLKELRVRCCCLQVRSPNPGAGCCAVLPLFKLYAFGGRGYAKSISSGENELWDLGLDKGFGGRVWGGVKGMAAVC